jgi:hypothetical protein
VLAGVTRSHLASAPVPASAADDRTYSVRRTASTLVLGVNGHVLLASDDIARISETLVDDLERYVAEMAREWVFIHAGVVRWRERAVLLPGSSYSGKTHLVVTLLHAGAEYYSDEFAVLDPTGHVHPYPRPLSIRHPDAPVQRCTAQALGARTGQRPTPVGLVLVTHYQPGGRWRPRRLSAGSALLALLAHSVSIRQRPAAVLDTLVRVVQTAPAVSSARGDAPDLIETLSSMTSSREE